MRINNHELDAIRQASQKPVPTSPRTFFTLPKLSKDIPTESTTTVAESTFAKTLIDSGTIDVSRLPETLTSARQIIEVGLQNWLKDRIPKLNVINVCASIIPPQVLEQVKEDAPTRTHWSIRRHSLTSTIPGQYVPAVHDVQKASNQMI